MPTLSFSHLIPENGHVIGEIACGHEGDIDKLFLLIDSVADGGAKIVKFQMFSLLERAVQGEKAWDIFSKLVLSEEDWERAVSYAREKELYIIADVYGEYSLSLAKRLGVDGYKIHSEDLLNSFFIAEVARESKLVFISVGSAHRVEIYSLLNFLKKEELLSNVVLMTGVQTFPTPLEAHSLQEVSDLIEKYSAYGVKVGFSDHIAGDQEEAQIVPLMALAKGACVIEKHITFDRKNEWIDYHSALDKDGFACFVERIKTLAPLLSPIGPMSKEEKQYRQMFKKSPVVKHDLPAGQILGGNDIEFRKNTSNAIPVPSLSLANRELNRDMSKGELCKPSNFKNKVGGIIVARCTSSRLPNKAIRKIQGRETIALVIDRMKRCKTFDCLILATSTDPSDDVLVEIAEREKILSFRGSLENVSLRFFEAAEFYQLDYFVRITGDSLLCDEVMLDVAVKSHLESGRDVTFIENMPFGTNKEVISMNTIKTILDKANIPSNTEYLEYYLENDRYFSKNVVTADYQYDPSLRITLDYEEDLKFFDAIYTHFKDINPAFTLRDALAWLQKNPHVGELNKHMIQKYSSADIDVTLNI